MATRGRTAGLCSLICFGAALSLATPRVADASFVEQAQFGNRNTIPTAWGDADLDGDLDLAVGNFNQANQLFLNGGDGTWTGQDAFGGGATFVVVWVDVDADGDLDVATANGYGQQNRLYLNDGAAHFTEQAQFGTGFSTSMAWGDFDGDGDPDVAVGNGLLGPEEQNRLYVNLGDGTFDERAEFGMGKTATLAWGDYDRDGDLDLAVGNGGFGAVGQNQLYVNLGDGTFLGVPEFGVGDTASLAWGDADGDGDLDLAVGNWNDGQNLLYVNNGNGTFTAQPRFGARDTNTVAWGDADLDGDLDLAVGNGDFQTADANYLYLNNGDGTFVETAEFGLGSTDALGWGDVDGDGDLDVASGNEHSPPQNYLYVNGLSGQTFLSVQLVGHHFDLGAGFSNRDGLGAVVEIYRQGFLGDPAQRLGSREVTAHGGFSAQNQPGAHFGLAGETRVDLRVTWPGSSGAHIVQDLVDVGSGQLVIHESSGTGGVGEGGDGTTIAPRRHGFLRAVPNPMSAATRIELAGAGIVHRVSIFDVLGHSVRTLELPPGAGIRSADWEGLTDAGTPVPAGLYLVRADGDRGVVGGRVMVLR